MTKSDEKLHLLSEDEHLYLQIMEDLNKPRGDGLLVDLKTRLHEDQIEQLKPLYNDKNDINSIFISCGRKWGKTELVGYTLWRHALLNPGAACYYISTQNVHVREILWRSGRIQRFLEKDGDKYIKKITEQDMTVWFKNGSFIRCVGSDNYMIANGLTPHFAVYDEFKGFNSRWHTEFSPNRAAKACPLIIIGTKPRPGNSNMDQYNDILEYAQKNPKEWYVAERTTFDNPISQLPSRAKQIEQDIKQLIARGEEDVVELEYYSRVLHGGKRQIFPMFRPEDHIFEHHTLVDEISRDLGKLEWYLITDPGTTTCFAALLVAMNPYTKMVYILDEIYEKDQKQTSTRRIYPRMEAKALDLFPRGDLDDDWLKVCDEAAAWYMNEVMDQYNRYFIPTDKIHNKKEQGISLIKDQLIHKLVKISDRCVELKGEIEKYALNDRGDIPKINDHLIDCYRYFNAAANYNMHEILQGVRVKADDSTMKERRFRGLEHEKEDTAEDWTKSFFNIDFD